jgi:ribosomal protein S9
MIRDVLAFVIAVALLFVAARLATTLQHYRRARERARDSERALGRTVIVEIPGNDDLVLFSEDDARFYYGERSVDKDLIVAARVLINGAPIAAVVSSRLAAAEARHPTSFTDQPEGIARDRWDVAIEATSGTTLVECGAIRERVSQELARAVFDAVRRDVERRDQAVTTPPRATPPDG